MGGGVGWDEGEEEVEEGMGWGMGRGGRIGGLGCIYCAGVGAFSFSAS